MNTITIQDTYNTNKTWIIKRSKCRHYSYKIMEGDCSTMGRFQRVSASVITKQAGFKSIQKLREAFNTSPCRVATPKTKSSQDGSQRVVGYTPQQAYNKTYSLHKKYTDLYLNLPISFRLSTDTQIPGQILSRLKQCSTLLYNITKNDNYMLTQQDNMLLSIHI